MLILVRHGQTGYGAEGLLCGRIDVPLSPRGIEEARDAARRLSGVPFSKIYSSTLTRAVQTAAEIAVFHACPVEHLDALREQSFGVFEGRAIEMFQQARKSSGVPPEDFRPEGGESYSDVRRRLEPFVSRLRVAAMGAEAVLIVAHGNVNRTLLSMLLGGAPGDYPQANCAVSTLRRGSDGAFVAECVNETEHLSRQE